MFKRRDTMPLVTDTNPAGGTGALEKYVCLSGTDAPPHIEFLAHVFLKPKASVGVHKHEENGEIWYYLKGEADYVEDGVTVPVRAGDVTVCRSGSAHGIRNTGTGDLEYIAVKFNI